MTSNPEPNIEQQAENSTFSGGMQAIQGDNNIQLQGNSTSVVQKIFEDVRVEGNFTAGNITQVYQTVNNLSEIPKPTGFPQNIPSSNTDRFIGRARDLEHLHQQLQRNNEVLIAAAVEGMGGVGKTELAIQHSLLHLQLHTYPGGICWLRAREEDIGLQIIQFARTDLGLEPPEDLELPERVRWCWQRWQQGNTLVVVDDVKDYKQIKPYLPPQASQFKVLITTRLKLNLAGSLFLEVLQEEDALKLLTELVGEEKVTLESIKAKELVQRLGYLPLALQLVGRYVKKYKISLTEMLRRLEKKGLGHPSLEVKEDDSAWTSDIKRGVAAAFELSWSELSESAQELGCLLSLFALAPIPWSLVESAAAEKDAEELEYARVEELEKLHLLTGEEPYLLHQLIREFLRNKQENLASGDLQKFSFCQVMVDVAKEIPLTPNQNQITALSPAIPHLAEVAQNLINAVSDKNLILVFTRLGRYYEGQSLYVLAQPWLEQGVLVIKSRLGEEHWDVSTSYNNLANLYLSQGQYEKAEVLWKKAIGLQQRLGEEHWDVAGSYNNLANLYLSQGQYEEAEVLLKKAIGLQQRLRGEEHLDVATSYNNLAGLYLFQGRYSDAEPLYKKAIELWQRLRGEEHPHVAISYNNLASLYDKQGQYKKAEPLYKKAIELQQRLLGEEHLDVATSYNNLAGLYLFQGRYSEAELLLKKALEIEERLLGEEHPDVATSYNNLAGLYKEQGQYKKAEVLYKKALEIKERRLGEEHPDVAIIYSSLASVYSFQGQYEKAEVLLKKAIGLQQRLRGEEYPHVAISYNNLANLYLSQKRYSEAEPLYKKALEINKRLLGEEHPHVVKSYNNLANLYLSQERYSEAEPLLKKALEIAELSLGVDHPDTTKIRKDLESLHDTQYGN